jgi:hypothetical protein
MDFITDLFKDLNTEKQEKLPENKHYNTYCYDSKEFYVEAILRLKLFEKCYIHESPQKFLKYLREGLEDIKHNRIPNFMPEVFRCEVDNMYFDMWTYLYDTQCLDNDEKTYPRRNLLINLRILCFVFYQINLAHELLKVFPEYGKEYHKYRAKFDGTYNGVAQSIKIIQDGYKEYLHLKMC